MAGSQHSTQPPNRAASQHGQKKNTAAGLRPGLHRLRAAVQQSAVYAGGIEGACVEKKNWAAAHLYTIRDAQNEIEVCRGGLVALQHLRHDHKIGGIFRT
jgi:hypothetical protein